MSSEEFDSDNLTKSDLLKLYLSMEVPRPKLNHLQAYMSNVNFKTISPDTFDLRIFINGVEAYTHAKKFHLALALIENVRATLDRFSENQRVHFSLFLYYKMKIFNDLSEFALTLSAARELVQFIDQQDVNSSEMSLFDKKQLSEMREGANGVISQAGLMSIFPPTGKIGRNDVVTIRYKNGKMIEGKYKRFEHDIVAGKCDVVAVYRKS
jgi:hypothetical protein